MIMQRSKTQDGVNLIFKCFTAHGNTVIHGCALNTCATCIGKKKEVGCSLL